MLLYTTYSFYVSSLGLYCDTLCWNMYGYLQNAFHIITELHFYTFTYLPLSLNYNPKLKNILSSIRLYNHVVLLDNSNLRCAFTSGLWKPKIYLSTGICSYLTTKELLAVILHEIHHKNNKVPLKLFIIQVLHALNFFLPMKPLFVKHILFCFRKGSR